MKFTQIEHFDQFESETLFWAELTDMPQEIQTAAKRIDGEAYVPTCFGMCVVHDHKTNVFEVIVDVNQQGISRPVYYIDNNGDKHFFDVELPVELLQEVFEGCSKTINQSYSPRENNGQAATQERTGPPPKNKPAPKRPAHKKKQTAPTR